MDTFLQPTSYKTYSIPLNKCTPGIASFKIETVSSQSLACTRFPCSDNTNGDGL
jgi:hypothetical protein